MSTLVGAALLASVALTAAPIRLEERFTGAQVVSGPLLKVHPLDPAAPTMPLRSTVVLHQRFEGDPFSSLRWPRAHAQLRPSASGRGLFLTGDEPHRYLITMAVRPRRYYRIRRDRLSPHPHTDLMVVEARTRSRMELNHPADTSPILAQGFVPLSSVSYMHHFPRGPYRSLAP